MGASRCRCVEQCPNQHKNRAGSSTEASQDSEGDPKHSLPSFISQDYTLITQLIDLCRDSAYFL